MSDATIPPADLALRASDATAPAAGLALRASDADREQAVARLRASFADGRLTRAELEDRAAAAYQARTIAQLSDLTADLLAADLPDPGVQQSRPGTVLDERLFWILLCVHPPAALVYWLVYLWRNRPEPTDGPEADLRPATPEIGQLAPAEPGPPP